MDKKTGKLSAKTWIAVACMVGAILAAAYVFFVDRPVRNGIREADEERVGLESRLEVLKTQAANVSGISAEVDRLTASGKLSWMPSYNSEEAELEMLHNLLDETTTGYQISFSNVTRSGNQIRRGCSLSFTAYSYEGAKRILYRLTHGAYRCLISSVSLSGITAEVGVHVSLSATFYETMAGGQPDMGLSEGDRGQAIDPMGSGMPFSSIIPSGIAESVNRTKDVFNSRSDYSGLDDIMTQNDD